MVSENAEEKLNKNITVFSLIVIGALGVMAFQVLPSMIIGMITDLGFTQQQVGKVSSAQLGGIALGSIINLWLIKVLSWRRIATFGLLGLLLCDLASMFLNDYMSFLIIRFLAGAAGGICVSFGAFALGNTAKADRNFGLFMSFQVVSAIIANMFLPGIVQSTGIICIFIVLLVLDLLALFVLLKNVPNVEVAEQEAAGTNSPRIWALCVIQLTAVLCFFIALGGFWTYIAPIGLAAGLSEQDTGRAISLGLFGGLAGSFVAAQLNIKLGRLLPVLFAVCAQFTALYILFSGFDFTVYTLAAGLFMFGWYMFFPYQLGMIAALDRDGRPMILANAVAGVGSGVGPLIVSFFLVGDFLPAYKIAALFLFLALSLAILVITISKADVKT
ncbi:MAG: MFS transporter [Gammaproteobacteria bacterium]|nr:MFS transporter [Gammaproteobacteria bacterium]